MFMQDCYFNSHDDPHISEEQFGYDMNTEQITNDLVGSPQTKAFHWGMSYTICAAWMESRPAEWRSCFTESAHLVLGRPLGLFQPWLLGLKSKTLRTGREDGMRWRCPNQRRRRCRRRDDAVGCLVRSRMPWLLTCCCQNTRRRRL